MSATAQDCTCITSLILDRRGNVHGLQVDHMDLWCPYHFPRSTTYTKENDND